MMNKLQYCIELYRLKLFYKTVTRVRRQIFSSQNCIKLHKIIKIGCTRPDCSKFDYLLGNHQQVN